MQASNALEDFLKNSTVSVASSSAKGAGDGNSSVHSTVLGMRGPESAKPPQFMVIILYLVVKSETNNQLTVGNHQLTKNSLLAEKVN